MALNTQEFKSFLESIISSIKSKPEAKNLVNKWIDGKYGKIIGWKIRSQDQEENYHMIFTPEEARLNVGEYPAFDIMIIGPLETILGMLTGKTRITSELKQKRIMVWGNLNEGITFGKIIGKIKSL